MILALKIIKQSIASEKVHGGCSVCHTMYKIKCKHVISNIPEIYVPWCELINTPVCCKNSKLLWNTDRSNNS